MSSPNKTNDTMRYVGLGSQMMAMLLVAVWGGWKLDNLIGWKFPLLLILLPLLALCISLYQLIREFNKPKK
jgi:F0F1-type ATP synthase assembly protein I